MPDFTLELECLAPVAGIDEAGRGPWAGPVVAAAVILESGRLPVSLHEGLDDSKKLSAKRREELFAILPDYAVIGVGVAEVEEIDRINILRASLLAMTRAVAALGVVPAMALVDGNQPPTLPCPVRCVVGGDGLSLSIAAASIIAKVTRDRLMHDLHREFPVYGWHTNAGYGTPEHQKGLAQHGVTPHHRRSFAPIRRLI